MLRRGAVQQPRREALWSSAPCRPARPEAESGTARRVRCDGVESDEAPQANPAALVQQPAKVMRIGTMIKQLLDEVKAAPLDDAARQRMGEIYSQSITELKDGLAPELVDELERLSLPFTEDTTPTEGELRIAQAQLVGWLEGLFHGIQAAIFAQQAAAKAQLDQMRGKPQLLPGAMNTDDGDASSANSSGSVGHYL
jgi:hypothetical protein